MSFIDQIVQSAKGVFQPKQEAPQPQEPQKEGFISKLINFFKPKQEAPVHLDVNAFENVPIQEEQQQENNSAFYNSLLEGFGRYGATPSAEAVQQMATAPDEYEIYRQNPYLLPAISILETGAGQNITRPKNVPDPQNIMNWGIYTDFIPKSQAESVERAKTGIGERMPYYQDFRDSGRLEDFVKTYAPAQDGNQGYLEHLIRAIQYFNPDFTYEINAN